MKKIELITCDAGDWSVLKLDDVIFDEGHDIPVYVWIDLLGVLGFDVIETEISNDDMEWGRY